MNIGIIQTRGLGDIIIAAPIAMHYVNLQNNVYWPIDIDFLPSFKSAFPFINFLPIDKEITGDSSADYFYNYPLKELTELGCESILCLYSHLSGYDLGFSRLQQALTFDAYKYAVANVPFSEKWNFKPLRNKTREIELFKKLDLNPNEPYILKHEIGSNFSIDLDQYIKEKNLRKISITSLTDNIFDWIGIIEHCKEFYGVDSLYVNMIEQLNININKYIYLRSPSPFTPTLITKWKYL